MMRELPASWSDIEIDSTLRNLAERAARLAGLSTDAWMERAIRRAAPQYFMPAAPVLRPVPQPAPVAFQPQPVAPVPSPMPIAQPQAFVPQQPQAPAPMPAPGNFSLPPSPQQASASPAYNFQPPPAPQAAPQPQAPVAPPLAPPVNPFLNRAPVQQPAVPMAPQAFVPPAPPMPAPQQPTPQNFDTINFDAPAARQAAPQAPQMRRPMAPLPPQHDDFAPEAPNSGDWIDSGLRNEPRLDAPKSRRGAAASIANALSGWRRRDENEAERAAPEWTGFADSSIAEQAPHDTFGEPLELNTPYQPRTKSKKKPLMIAMAIAAALVITLGAIAAQRLLGGHSNRITADNSAATYTPPALPTSRSSMPSRDMSTQAPAVPMAPDQMANNTPAPTPYVPPTATTPAPQANASLGSSNGGLLPSNLVSPQVAVPPPPPVTAMATPAPTQTAPQNITPPAVQMPAPLPAPAPVAAAPVAQPQIAQPELPPALPSRKTQTAATKPPAVAPAPATSNAANARKALESDAPKDPVKLAAWLDERAKTGDAVAEYRLGVLYALGQGVKQDYDRAAQLFQAAANGGVAEAQYNVAVMYGEGMGVTRDQAKAVEWYQKAAAQGNSNAAFNLGVAYSNGTGTKQDIQEAAKWFRRAASAGVINAQFNLGLLYERGEGVPASPVEAYAWYAAAASRGDQGAAQRRDHLASTLPADEMKKAQARAAQLQQTIQTTSAAAPAAPKTIAR